MKEVKEGYKMSQLGVIPNEWSVKSTAELFSFAGGLSISRDKQSEQGAYYLHYGDIHKHSKNMFDTETDKEWLPKIDVQQSKVKDEIILNTGDVVFADASEDYEGIGKSVVVFNQNNSPFISGLHTIVAKPITDELLAHYKRYCFSINQVRKQFRVLAAGATVYGISRSNIGKIKIIVPPLSEQQKIADILSTVDEQIDNIDRLIEKTKELKKGLMQQLLTKGIGHTEFKETEIGVIPKEWKVKKLEDVCQNVTIGLVKTMTKYYVDDGVPLIRNSDIKENYILSEDMITLDKKFAEENADKKLKLGDVVTVHTGDICTSAVVEKNLVGAHGFATLHSTTLEGVLNNYYLSWYLNSEIAKKQAYSFSTGDGRNNLNLKDFVKILVPVPNKLDEQLEIVKILNETFTKATELDIKREKLQQLKKGLMQQLLTGKIRVKVD